MGALEVHLRMDGCRSLKDKRHVLRPVVESLRRTLGVSCAEVADQDLWNVATIGVACASTDRAHAGQILQRALALIEERSEVKVEGSLESYY